MPSPNPIRPEVGFSLSQVSQALESSASKPEYVNVFQLVEISFF